MALQPWEKGPAACLHDFRARKRLARARTRLRCGRALPPFGPGSLTGALFPPMAHFGPHVSGGGVYFRPLGHYVPIKVCFLYCITFFLAKKIKPKIKNCCGKFVSFPPMVWGKINWTFYFRSETEIKCYRHCASASVFTVSHLKWPLRLIFQLLKYIWKIWRLYIPKLIMNLFNSFGVLLYGS